MSRRLEILPFHKGLLSPTMFIIIKTPYPSSEHHCEVELQSGTDQKHGVSCKNQPEGRRFSL